MVNEYTYQRSNRRRISPEERRRRKRRVLLFRRLKILAFLILAGGLIGLLTAMVFRSGDTQLPNGSQTVPVTVTGGDTTPVPFTAAPTGTTPATSIPNAGQAVNTQNAGNSVPTAASTENTQTLENIYRAMESGGAKLAINTYTDNKYMMLVNKTYRLDEKNIPEDLVDITKRVSSLKEIYLEKKAAEQYEAMTKKMTTDGINELVAVSGYRDYEYQKGLFSRQVEKQAKTMSATKAEAEAAKIVALPGTSEHQTGLAIDVSTPGMGYALEEWFDNTEAYKWLSDNAWEYGFIIRYQRETYDITQIAYEPWHLRYVGKEHAEKIKTRGLTLEEYWASLQ